MTRATETDATPDNHYPEAGAKIIVGMSGGVDSSVTALLLQEQGYAVEGLFMKNWDEDDGTDYCTAKQDLADAQAVCDRLGLVLHTANFAAEYWDSVFEHFLHEYRAGRTPNPDILCNREIKFKVFMQYAKMLGADAIATGHYARLLQGAGQTRLFKGLDPQKDQSYFLHAVTAQAFAKSCFPIGNHPKAWVRAKAEAAGLITHNKKDSTGICFIGERRFSDFLSTYLPAQPGRICTPDGRDLGEHQGLMYHTLGQRQGLGIGGVKGGDESPWYVAAKDLSSNTLIVVQGQDHPLLFSQTLTTEPCHWINPLSESDPFRCQAKTRYRQPDQACQVTVTEQTPEGPKLQVVFDAPQRAVTPGQYAVFYQGDHCLGGAIIRSTSV